MRMRGSWSHGGFGPWPMTGAEKTMGVIERKEKEACVCVSHLLELRWKQTAERVVRLTRTILEGSGGVETPIPRRPPRSNVGSRAATWVCWVAKTSKKTHPTHFFFRAVLLGRLNQCCGLLVSSVSPPDTPPAAGRRPPMMAMAMARSMQASTSRSIDFRTGGSRALGLD